LTFNAMSGFERHRAGRRDARSCRTPIELAALGWTIDKRGRWRMPLRIPRHGTPPGRDAAVIASKRCNSTDAQPATAAGKAKPFLQHFDAQVPFCEGEN
jgi:hypothetical protein